MIEATLRRARRWVRRSDAAPRTPVFGWAHADFEALVSLAGRLVDEQGGGAAICVYHRGRPVADLWAGQRDSDGRPWLADTLAPSFSTTKGVASTVLHVMVDRGLIDYDAPVCRYWPEFAAKGKQDITVRHVLTHRAGLYHIRRMIDHAERLLDWEYVIHALERAEPLHPPGERTGYHGLTFGFLVGELVQRVTGQPFSQTLHEVLAQPLGLDGLFIGAPEAAIQRAASLHWPRRAVRSLTHEQISTTRLAAVLRAGQKVLRLGGLQLDGRSVLDALAPHGIDHIDFSAGPTLSATIPAANGLFTARSLARLYAALAAGGTLDGVRILSPATFARATERQGRTRRLHVIPFDMGWRLGYHGVLTTRGILPRAFGHFGLGGSGAWADPDHQLAVALIVNRGIGSPFGDLRILRVGATALTCAGSRAEPAA